MRSSQLVRAVALSALLAFAGQAAAADTPATTAFTYQGRITTGGANQTALYDFQFKLFDAVTAGTQKGGTVALSGVQATAGLFTVNLDFGQQFNSSRRWLEISVRQSGGGAFTTLAPRQELTAAPHAEGLVLPIVGIDNSSAAAINLTNTGGDGIDTTGFGNGVEAFATASGGNGIIAEANLGTNAFGVWGISSTGLGVVGQGVFEGGEFFASDPTGIGALGFHSAGTGTAAGVEGDSFSTDPSAFAVLGHLNTTTGGGFSAAVRGQNDSTGGGGIGVWGSQAGTGWGVYATASGAGIGVNAFAGTGGTAVNASGGSFGVNASGATGVQGTASGGDVGVQGNSAVGGGSSIGVLGISTAAAGNGVVGRITAGTTAYAVWGQDNTGAAGSFAGEFDGNVRIFGSISKTSGTFQIDHPLDPANKFLFHSFVESPDMMNVYNGNAQLDGNGMATIALPSYFEALNEDFRYQLTAVGAPGPNLYVAQTVKNNSFVVAGGSPGGMVSWQVTGIRHDPYADAHRVQVEVTKSAEERGRFIFPELYGMPASASIEALKGNPTAPAQTVSNQLGVQAPAPVAAPVLPAKLTEGR